MDFLHDQYNTVKSIFTTCDTENTNLVPVSKLIELIRPYLLQDLNALERLRLILDPLNTEALVTSEEFCEAMTNWCQTLESSTEEIENSELNKTPCNPMSADIIDMPFSILPHSTPRASLGDKLPLRCKDLLNLSNISGYSLSSSQTEECEPDKTILEEEIKMLKQQLSKTSHELLVIKQQLAASEDINEQLQQDLGKANRILQQEQKVNEHLTKDIKYSEDLRDELAYCKKHIGQLKSKLEQLQREGSYTQKLNNELAEEKCKLQKKAEADLKYREQMENELVSATQEVNSKEAQLQAQLEMLSALQRDCSRQKDVIDQLMEENNRLNQQQLTLAKSGKSTASSQKEKLTILENSEESFDLDLKTNGNSHDQDHNSLYTEICKTGPLANSSYSELYVEGDQLKTLLEADKCRFTLRGVEQRLKKTENALELKSHECEALDKNLAEVQAQLLESETSLRDYTQALQRMLQDLGDSLLDSALQAQITELKTNNTPSFCLRRLAKIFVDENARLQEKVVEAQQELKEPVLNRSRPAKASKKVTGYSKQQLVIDKLKEKNEFLESLLKTGAATQASRSDELNEIASQIAEKHGTCEELEVRCGQLSENVRATEEKLRITEAQLETVQQKMEETEAKLRACEQVSEKRSINKFTLSGGRENANGALQNGDACGLNELRLVQTSTYLCNNKTDDVFDVPSLDVRVFADELNYIETSPRSREELGRDKLEQMVSSLTLELLAHCSTLTERIEKETKKYRREYEGLLNLINDISHRLRDHVCIGTAEPIIPVHVLLEEVKQRVKMLVQNAGQVSVLISEHRIKWCWDLMIHQMALLQKDNEALRVLSRITSQPSEPDVSTPATSVETDKPKRSNFGCSLKSTILFVVIVFVVVALIIAINQTCRMIVADSQYCPFDGALQRINQGLPPF